MMFPRPASLALACIALAALALVACSGSSSGDKTATPAPATKSATAAPSPAASAAPGDDIRDVDLANLADVKKLVSDTNGQFDATRVIYADLTGGGQEDAVIPVASGGTLGDVAIIVVAPAAGGSTTTLLKKAPNGNGITASVEGGKLVTTEPVPGPDDPECCPSQLRKTTYFWDGARLEVETVATEPNPAGGAKGTPSAN